MTRHKKIKRIKEDVWFIECALEANPNCVREIADRVVGDYGGTTIELAYIVARLMQSIPSNSVRLFVKVLEDMID